MPIGKRKNRDFVQIKVWRYVKRCGPVGREQVAKAFRCSLVAAGMNLRRLYDKGCLYRFGAAKRTVYVASPTPPEDYRGTAINSIAALDKSAKRANTRIRGQISPKENVRQAAPPPLPTLADLIARH